MSRRTTKQRRASACRRWVRRHEFVDTSTGDPFLPGVVLYAACPFAATRLFGLGWTPDLNAYRLVRR